MVFFHFCFFRKFSKVNLNPFFKLVLGVNPSFLHDLYYFSKSFWKKLFQKNGFAVISIKSTDYLYSGYGVFKMKLYNSRKFLAKRNITGTYCFVLKKIKDN